MTKHLFEPVVDWVQADELYIMGVNIYSDNPHRRFYEEDGWQISEAKCARIERFKNLDALRSTMSNLWKKWRSF